MNWQTAVLLPVLSAAVYYLAVQADITKWLWSHYPESLEKFLWCPACSGFWYGVFLWTLGHALHWIPFQEAYGDRVLACGIAGLWCLFWTPILAAGMLYAFDYVYQGADHAATMRTAYENMAARAQEVVDKLADEQLGKEPDAPVAPKEP